jgi:hypothetical protein
MEPSQLVAVLQAHKSQLSPSAVKKIAADFASHGIGLIPIIFSGDVVNLPSIGYQHAPVVVAPTAPSTLTDEEN